MDDTAVLGLTATVVIGLIALSVVQLILLVVSLVVLARTPRERVRLEARWPWVLIILFTGIIGAIIFLGAGRKPVVDDGAPSPRDAVSRPPRQFPGPFGRVVRFVREVVAELKKVVRPTRSEVITYTSTVLVFVAIIMGFVLLVDYGVGKLTFLVFG